MSIYSLRVIESKSKTENGLIARSVLSDLDGIRLFEPNIYYEPGDRIYYDGEKTKLAYVQYCNTPHYADKYYPEYWDTLDGNKARLNSVTLEHSHKDITMPRNKVFKTGMKAGYVIPMGEFIFPPLKATDPAHLTNCINLMENQLTSNSRLVPYNFVQNAIYVGPDSGNSEYIVFPNNMNRPIIIDISNSSTINVSDITIYRSLELNGPWTVVSPTTVSPKKLKVTIDGRMKITFVNPINFTGNIGKDLDTLGIRVYFEEHLNFPVLNYINLNKTFKTELNMIMPNGIGTIVYNGKFKKFKLIQKEVTFTQQGGSLYTVADPFDTVNKKPVISKIFPFFYINNTQVMVTSSVLYRTSLPDGIYCFFEDNLLKIVSKNAFTLTNTTSTIVYLEEDPDGDELSMSDGSDILGYLYNDIPECQIVTNSFGIHEFTTPPINKISKPTALTYNNSLYMVSGLDTSIGGTVNSTKMSVYDTITNQWKVLNGAISVNSAKSIPYTESQFIIYGGIDNSGAKSDKLYLFDAIENTSEILYTFDINHPVPTFFTITSKKLYGIVVDSSDTTKWEIAFIFNLDRKTLILDKLNEYSNVLIADGSKMGPVWNYKNKAYVVGDIDTVSGKPFFRAFSVNKDEVIETEKLAQPNTMLGINTNIVNNDMLFVSDSGSGIIVYNLTENVWETFTNPAPVFNGTLYINDNRIYHINNGSTFTYAVFDYTSKKWLRNASRIGVVSVPTFFEVDPATLMQDIILMSKSNGGNIVEFDDSLLQEIINRLNNMDVDLEYIKQQIILLWDEVNKNIDVDRLEGIINNVNLPSSVFDIGITVPDRIERFNLTISEVQTGDTVKQLDTGIMYLVIDDTKLDSDDGYMAYFAADSDKFGGLRPDKFNKRTDADLETTGFKVERSGSQIIFTNK